MLVSTDWLAGELEVGDLRVVDATYVLPGDGRDPRAEFEKAHIPHAVFFDIAELSDSATSLPTMLPSAAKFSRRMQSLGIGDGNRIVVYDNSPYHSAARAWWMLRLFGAHEVAILDGGFAKWQAEEASGKRHANRAPSSFYRLGGSLGGARSRPDGRES